MKIQGCVSNIATQVDSPSWMCQRPPGGHGRRRRVGAKILSNHLGHYWRHERRSLQARTPGGTPRATMSIEASAISRSWREGSLPAIRTKIAANIKTKIRQHTLPWARHALTLPRLPHSRGFGRVLPLHPRCPLSPFFNHSFVTTCYQK